MQIFNVNELKPHPQNDYYFDDIQGDNWKEFKKSIETSGVIEPIVITQEKMIVSGHQRVRACKELNIQEIGCKVKIYDNGDGEILRDLIETNLRQRGIGNTNPIKFGRCIKALEEYYKIGHGGDRKSNPTMSDLKSQSELAKDIGVSQDTLNNHKKLLTLIPELQELVETGQVSASTGSRVWARMSQEEQEKFFNEIGKSKISELTQKETQELLEILNRETQEKEELKENNKILNNKILEMQSKQQEKEELVAQLKLLEERLRVQSTNKATKTEYIEKIPDDYHEIKSNLHRYGDLDKQYHSLLLDKQNKEKQIEELKKEISEIKITPEDLEYDNKLKNNVIFFMNGINEFIKEYGGYIWLADHKDELKPREKELYAKAVSAIWSWSENLKQQIND